MAPERRMGPDDPRLCSYVWPGAVMVRAWRHDLEVAGRFPTVPLAGNDLRQVVHAYMPL